MLHFRVKSRWPITTQIPLTDSASCVRFGGGGRTAVNLSDSSVAVALFVVFLSAASMFRWDEDFEDVTGGMPEKIACVEYIFLSHLLGFNEGLGSWL